jgi:hypothetical protein
MIVLRTVMAQSACLLLSSSSSTSFYTLLQYSKISAYIPSTFKMHLYLLLSAFLPPSYLVCFSTPSSVCFSMLSLSCCFSTFFLFSLAFYLFCGLLFFLSFGPMFSLLAGFYSLYPLFSLLLPNILRPYFVCLSTPIYYFSSIRLLHASLSLFTPQTVTRRTESVGPPGSRPCLILA